MSTGLVSVIVPTHNRVRFLPLTLHSVLWQEGIPIEVLVVDDGSTDDVRRVVEQPGDSRVRLLRLETPHGVSAARNRGVAEASGNWIAFVDDDDLWAPHKLLSQVRAAEQHGNPWVYTGAVHLAEDLRLLAGAPPPDPSDVAARLPRANIIPGGCSNVIVRRDVLPPEPFDRSLGTYADWDLWIRLSRRARPAAVEQPMVGYRIHGANMSLDTHRLLAELSEIEKRYGGPIDWAAFFRYLGRLSLRSHQKGRAIKYCDAARYFCQAARLDRQYRHEDFVPDLVEVAQSVGRALHNRLGRLVNRVAPPARNTRSPRRHGVDWAWVEQAQPWIDRLMRVQFPIESA